MSTQIAALEMERLHVIELRKLALQGFAGSSVDRKKMINSEFIQPLNQRLVEINRTLGK